MSKPPPSIYKESFARRGVFAPRYVRYYRVRADGGMSRITPEAYRRIARQQAAWRREQRDPEQTLWIVMASTLAMLVGVAVGLALLARGKPSADARQMWGQVLLCAILAAGVIMAMVARWRRR